MENNHYISGASPSISFFEVLDLLANFPIAETWSQTTPNNFHFPKFSLSLLGDYFFILLG